MNELLGQQKQYQNEQTNEITVNVNVNLPALIYNTQLLIDLSLTFNALVDWLYPKIMKERKQVYYEEYIEYYLDNGLVLQSDDNRTIQNLGFIHNCTLYVRPKQIINSEQKQNKKRIYKIIVDLQTQKIQLIIEQYTTAPVSCVFHDILVELFQNQLLTITRPCIFFINETEIEPFDFRQIQDFQTNKGILVKTILENTEANQDSIEKCQFAFNKSKEIKLCLKNMIKIQYNNDIEMLAYTDTSLKDVFQDICEDIKIIKNYPNHIIRFYMNNEQLIELNNIYAMDNIKLDIQYPNETQEIIFQVNGEFYKKIKIQGFTEYYYFQFEEFMPINTSMTEFQQYLKFKIFGPYQNDYREHIHNEGDNEVVINYLNIK